MNTKRRGVSLVELIIVLAISALMVTIAIATFGSRKRVVADDAAKQIESIYQTARNEAQQGLGPTNGATFNPGETLFGQAMQFRNNCTGTTSCITVYKLKQNGTTVTSYESYDVNLREGLMFDLTSNLTSSSCPAFGTCYQSPGSSVYKGLGVSPINMAAISVPMVVVRNGNGGNYLFASNNGSFSGNATTYTTDSTTTYTPNRQGLFRLSIYRPDNPTDAPATAPYRYNLVFDLSGNNQTSISNP